MNTSKQINAMIALLLLLLLGVGVYTIYDPFRAEAEADRTHEEIVSRAAKTYARNCHQCHGNNGEGRIGPALNPEFRDGNPNLENFTDVARRQELQHYVMNTLQCGRIGTLMPPWSLEQGGSLNDEQIRQLVTLITNPTDNAWEEVEHFSSEEPLPEVTEITAGAVATGSITPVCGQRAPATPTPDQGPVESVTSQTIVATDNKFNVTRFGIPVNQQVTVTLQNNGAAIHNWAVQNVRNSQNQAIETMLLPAGQSQTLTFTVPQAGTYPFLCTVHPTEMRGTLVVQ